MTKWNVGQLKAIIWMVAIQLIWIYSLRVKPDGLG